MLTPDMRAVIQAAHLCFAATVTPDGRPNVSPKGTIRVWDDSHLFFLDIASPGTRANLAHTPWMEVNVVEQLSRRGYRFAGPAALYRAGTPEFDEGVRRLCGGGEFVDDVNQMDYTVNEMRDRDVAAVRRFNRFYTKQIGILDEGLLRSPFSLAEVRVLYEIANGTDVTAAALADELQLDPGYLSRILRRFLERGLLRRETSTVDGRRSHLTLTEKGRRTFAGLDARQDEDVAALLVRLSAAGRQRLVDAMHAIEDVLGAPARDSGEPYLLRQHQPGDMGWITHRHGVLYSREYGYDERFEALVAKIAGEFIEHLDPARERCWIAERRGEIVGSVFLVKQSATVAKLRLLYVEPSARGLGIGARLVDECIRFARRAGYRKITLWTQSELLAARRIYLKTGFKLVGKQRHRSFSRDDLVSETWELKL